MKDTTRHYAALAGAAVLWLLVLMLALWVVAVPAEAQVREGGGAEAIQPAFDR